MTATAMMIFASGIFIFAITNNIARAGNYNKQDTIHTPAKVWMVVMNNKVYEVYWDQLTESYKYNYACGHNYALRKHLA